MQFSSFWSLTGTTMSDYLFLPFKYSSTISNSTASSTSSSKKSSLSCSRPDFRPIHSDIVRRTLHTNFLEATSLPVNVPIHKSREASRPPTTMREQFDRCIKQLPFSLASKLFSAPSGEDNVEGYEVDMVKGGQMTMKVTETEKRSENMDDLMFKLDL